MVEMRRTKRESSLLLDFILITTAARYVQMLAEHEGALDDVGAVAFVSRDRPFAQPNDLHDKRVYIYYIDGKE